MMNYRKIIVVLLLVHCFTGLAQTDPCLTNLKDANLKSEQGWYDEAIQLVKQALEDCILDDDDKIKAYKLLITNYLAIDNLEGAEVMVSKIMKIDPNYEADKLNDDALIIQLFEKYKPTIILKATVHGGVNFSQTTASNTYSIVADNESEGLDNYKTGNASQFGFGLEYKLYNSLWLNTSIQFRSSKYGIEIPNIQNRTVKYEENLSFIELPVSAKYYFSTGSFEPFVQAGLNFSFLNTALGELSRDDLSDIVNRKIQRNSFYLGYVLGAGLAYQHKNLGAQLGVNYLLSPRNLNKEGTRFENLDVAFKYYYVDNDFSINHLQLNVGLSYALVFKNVLKPGKS